MSLRDKADAAKELSETPYVSRKFTVPYLDGNELGFDQMEVSQCSTIVFDHQASLQLKS